MKKVILGIVLGWVLAAAGILAYFMTGMAPVATSAPPMPFEKTLAKLGLSTAIYKEAPKSVPFTLDRESVIRTGDRHRFRHASQVARVRGWAHRLPHGTAHVAIVKLAVACGARLRARVGAVGGGGQRQEHGDCDPPHHVANFRRTQATLSPA